MNKLKMQTGNKQTWFSIQLSWKIAIERETKGAFLWIFIVSIPRDQQPEPWGIKTVNWFVSGSNETGSSFWTATI